MSEHDDGRAKALDGLFDKVMIGVLLLMGLVALIFFVL